MITKICSKCKQTKNIDKFNKKGKSFTYHCKDCQNQYTRQHYKNNKDSYIKRAIKVKNKLRDYIQDIKTHAPCTDCGKFYPPYVMQFDHIPDKGEKIKCVAHMTMYGNLEKIKQEIEKCELVCANCHAERTHKRNSC